MTVKCPKCNGNNFLAAMIHTLWWQKLFDKNWIKWNCACCGAALRVAKDCTTTMYSALAICALVITFSLLLLIGSHKELFVLILLSSYFGISSLVMIAFGKLEIVEIDVLDPSLKRDTK